jgi:hypothetical protein
MLYSLLLSDVREAAVKLDSKVKRNTQKAIEKDA